MLLLLKPIEKYNQDSVLILQCTLPYPTHPMEQNTVRYRAGTAGQGVKNYRVDASDNNQRTKYVHYIRSKTVSSTREFQISSARTHLHFTDKLSSHIVWEYLAITLPAPQVEKAQF